MCSVWPTGYVYGYGVLLVLYRKSWGINALGSFIAEVETEDGTTGVGVSIGGEPGV